MKKRYAVMMTAAMLTGIVTTTALAEGLGTDAGTQAQISGPQMPGSSEDGQAPQFGQNGEMPEMNGQAPQFGQNGEMPEMNGQAPQFGQNGEMPEMNGQAPQFGQNGQMPQMMGRGPEDGFGFIDFEDYVTDGTISQETYEAISQYMEENKPELPEGMTSGERPELPEGAAEGERPELPEDAENGERPEMKEGEGPDLLKDLLEAEVITQEEYDALAEAREANRPQFPGKAAGSTSSADDAQEAAADGSEA